MSRFVSLSAGIYARLLRLCPMDLRAEFGEEMTLVFADDLADSLRRGCPAAAFGVWSRAAVELAALSATHALSVHGVVTSLIASGFAMACFTAELAAARAQGPTRLSTAPAYVSVLVVLIPGIAAAVVAFVASRLGLRTTPQRLLD